MNSISIATALLIISTIWDSGSRRCHRSEESKVMGDEVGFIVGYLIPILSVGREVNDLRSEKWFGSKEPFGFGGLVC